MNIPPVSHPYTKNSEVYNILFHPLHGNDDEKKIGCIILNLVITLMTAGLWQIPFWIINRLDHKKIEQWDEERVNHITRAASESGVFEKTSKKKDKEIKVSLPNKAHCRTTDKQEGQNHESASSPANTEIIEEEVINLEVQKEEVINLEVQKSVPLSKNLEAGTLLPTRLRPSEVLRYNKLHPENPLEAAIIPIQKPTIQSHSAINPPIKERIQLNRRSSIIELRKSGVAPANYKAPEGKFEGIRGMTIWANKQIQGYGFTVDNLKSEKWKTGEPFFALADILEDSFFIREFSSVEEKLEAAFEIFSKNRVPKLLDAADRKGWDFDSIYTYLREIRTKCSF